MGTYTEHWNTYLGESKRNTVVALLFLVFGLPATAVIAYLVGLVTGEYPVLVQVGLLVVWLVVFTVHVLRSTRIVCPRCATTYGQSKWQRACPSCSLPILQEEP
jgi:cation transporter-like permease